MRYNYNMKKLFLLFGLFCLLIGNAKILCFDNIMSWKLQNPKNNKTFPRFTNTHFILFARSKEGSQLCNAFLKYHSPGFLEQHHTLYIADITSAPWLVKHLLIIPKMKTEPFDLLYIDNSAISDKLKKKYAHSSIIILELQDKSLIPVRTIHSQKELESFFQQSIYTPKFK